MDVDVPVLEVSLWQQKVLLRRLPRESSQTLSFKSNETKCVCPGLFGSRASCILIFPQSAILASIKARLREMQAQREYQDPHGYEALTCQMKSRYKFYVQARELKFLLRLLQDVNNRVSGLASNKAAERLGMKRSLDHVLNEMKPELEYVSCSRVLPDLHAACLKMKQDNLFREAAKQDLPQNLLYHLQCAVRRNVRCTKYILDKLETTERGGFAP